MTTAIAEPPKTANAEAADLVLKEINTFCLERKAFEITTDEDLARAEEVLKACYEREKIIEKHCDGDIKAAHELHKSLVAKKKNYLEPVQTLITQLKQQVQGWLIRQKAKRDREIAEAEAAARKAEEEKRLADAQQMQDQGHTEAAEEILAAPIAPVLTSAPAPKPKAASVTLSKVWKYEITDEKLIPREYLTIDESKIGRVVKAHSGTIQIPGVRIYAEDVAVKRRGF